MAAASISSFRITRTRSRRVAAPTARDIMANIWMHNGHLQVEGEKMSKSLGNFFTINELLNSQKFGNHDWPGAVLRFAMLQTHHRQPIDWTLRNQKHLGMFLRWRFYQRRASLTESCKTV